MNQAKSALPGKTVGPDSVALDHAFEALPGYAAGSGRSQLLPIDEAVAGAANDPVRRSQLETRLLNSLAACRALEGREYTLAKLALVGSEASLPSLAALLDDAQLDTSVRNALEAIPGKRAGKILRDSLTKIDRSRKLGVINSIGVRRDAESVSVLAKLLVERDPELAGAAAAALGGIGTAKAAKALLAFQPQAPDSLRLPVADALLVCGEHLRAGGKNRDASALYRSLATPTQPKHVREAAARGLQACGGEK